MDKKRRFDEVKMGELTSIVNIHTERFNEIFTYIELQDKVIVDLREKLDFVCTKLDLYFPTIFDAPEEQPPKLEQSTSTNQQNLPLKDVWGVPLVEEIKHKIRTKSISSPTTTRRQCPPQEEMTDVGACANEQCCATEHQVSFRDLEAIKRLQIKELEEQTQAKLKQENENMVLEELKHQVNTKSVWGPQLVETIQTRMEQEKEEPTTSSFSWLPNLFKASKPPQSPTDVAFTVRPAETEDQKSSIKPHVFCRETSELVAIDEDARGGHVSQKQIFACSHCDKTYTTHYNLEQHTRATHGDQRYECKICAKSFKWASGLTVHNKKCHPESLPDANSISVNHLKVFADAGIPISKLIDKADTETNQTPHVPIVVDARADKPSKKSKEFQCQTCLKCYSTKSNLEQHIGAKHLNARYDCPLCPPGTSFKWASGLTVHVKKEHPGITTRAFSINHFHLEDHMKNIADNIGGS